jgi:Flp pilus assembly protein TadB
MEQLGRFVRGFGRFWYDFIVGDDPKIAGAVAVVLVVGAVLVGVAGATSPTLVVGLAVLLVVAFVLAMAVDVSGSRRGQS